MTTDEHLDLIVAMCRKMLGLALDEPQSFMETQIAAYKSTILAIDGLRLIHESTPIGEYSAWDSLQAILAAFPIELLKP